MKVNKKLMKVYRENLAKAREIIEATDHETSTLSEKEFKIIF